MSNTHIQDVHDFHQKFGLLSSAKPTYLTQRKLKERIECMQEELDEFATACGLADTTAGATNMTTVNCQGALSDQADALIDLVYFALGTADMMGLPWQALWDDVQRANMAKVRGETKRGHKVDVTKPPGWIGPNGDAVLAHHDFNRDDFEDEGGEICEEACLDDDLGAAHD